MFQMLPKASYIVHAPENHGSSARIPLYTTVSAQRHLTSQPTQAFSSVGCICFYPINAHIPRLLNSLVLPAYLHLMCPSSLSSHSAILLTEPHPVFLLLPIYTGITLQALLTRQQSKKIINLGTAFISY